MSETQYVSSSNLTQEVTFQSKNVTDQVEYVGIVSGILTYQQALSYQDIDSYNAAVQQADPTVGAANTLTYFLISIANGSGLTTTYVFSNAWIISGSFNVINEKVIVNIAVYDAPDNDHNAILTLLQANGFVAFISSVVS
jgi:hypothetical protein